jgi:hypothetical protein
MAHRSRVIGANLELRSGQLRGTIVSLLLPTQEADREQVLV